MMSRSSALLTALLLTAGTIEADSPPRVFILDGPALLEARTRVRAGDALLMPAYDRLREDAEKALERGPWTVTQKTMMPPSGDRHDYMSVGPYWWPNPNTDDGLPYVNRDGQINPDYHGDAYDATRMGQMVGAARTLARAWYFSGDDRFAVHAARILRVWFLDPATRMNPNLHFAQAVPGHNDGRSTGIIETGSFVDLVDAVGMLAEAGTWSDADQTGMTAWFADYLEWLRTSPRATENLGAGNNIGSFYEVQVACFALFTGQPDIARQILAENARRRIATQVEPDGSQPHELRRTNSFSYSTFNLTALFSFAALGSHIEIDLWNYATADGRSIRKALDFLVPYLDPEVKWPYPQGGTTFTTGLAPSLLQAAHVYGDARYLEAFARISAANRRHHGALLLHPPPAGTVATP